MYPDAAFSKLIITCSYDVCGAERQVRGWNGGAEGRKTKRKLNLGNGKSERCSRMWRQWRTHVAFCEPAALRVAISE